MDDKAVFISFLQKPSTLAELQAGQQGFWGEEIQPFLSSLQHLYSSSERNVLLHEFASLLPHVDSFHAGMLAVLCGGMVEQGGDVSLPINATLEFMASQLPLAKDYMNLCEQLSPEELFQRFPEALRAHAAFPFLLPAVMTMLCRDKETRKQWQQRQNVITLINDLEEAGEIPFYLKEIFSLVDDKDLLVLDQVNARGFLVRLVGVQNVMYHCYALLQQTLLEHTGPGYLDAEPTDPKVVRFAQNHDLTPQDYREAHHLSDYQRFGFSSPQGLLFFPGSASFSEIPTFDGMPLLFIEKKTMTFQWQPANMYPVLHEALQSRVDMVRELTQEEVKDWLQRIFK